MFKLMHEMSDKEVRICMSLLFFFFVIETIKRETRGNSIFVRFTLMNDCKDALYEVSLLPDCIEQLSDGVRVKQDGLYLYKQFMIAKGYSEFWKDNIFV